jgi:hypothetical protein
VEIEELGMRLLVDVRRGQKTGLFLDQRENRRLVRQVEVDQVQTRSLAMDPDVYWEIARERGGPGPALGVNELVRALRAARPGLVVGNFARARGERRVA